MLEGGFNLVYLALKSLVLLSTQQSTPVIWGLGSAVQSPGAFSPDLLVHCYKLAVFTHPDIALCVSKLAQFSPNSTSTHLKAIFHVLAISKGVETCALCTNGRSLQYLFLVILTQIGDQMSTTEDRLPAIYICLTVVQLLGHLKPHLQRCPIRGPIC